MDLLISKSGERITTGPGVLPTHKTPGFRGFFRDRCLLASQVSLLTGPGSRRESDGRGHVLRKGRSLNGDRQFSDVHDVPSPSSTLPPCLPLSRKQGTTGSGCECPVFSSLLRGTEESDIRGVECRFE